MKLFTTMMACALCACASPAVKQARVYDPNDYKPPTDLELTVNDNQKVPSSERSYRDVTRNEYQLSVDKIRQQMDNEMLVLQMCGEVHQDPSDYCYKVLKGFCTEDVLLDAKGDHHPKPYCTREYFNTHNPVKTYYPQEL